MSYEGPSSDAERNSIGQLIWRLDGGPKFDLQIIPSSTICWTFYTIQWSFKGSRKKGSSPAFH